MSQEDAPQAGQEPTPETEPKEGQEPRVESQGTHTFDAEYVKSLRAEAAKHRTEAQEARAKLQEREDAEKTELERSQSKLQRAEQARAEAEAKLLRYEVAQEKEVPAKLVPLLTAASREDLEAQADLILESAKPEAPQFDGGVREPAPDPKSPEQAHNDLALLALGIQPTK